MEELNPDQDSRTPDLFTLLKLGDEVEGLDTRDDGGDKEDEDEEFSFMCGGANTSPIAAEDAFINGQIKPLFPLFNRDLFSPGEESNLATSPPVRRVFVETSEASGGERKAVEASPEICKKSNSTGFSKIWRFRDLLGRSNSDGRDAFVFLDHSQAPPPVVDKVANVREKRGKRASLSAHEVYLKSKGKEEGRRRSYLPYKPELLGFFTNVNGGLSKNVHPF